VGQAERLFGGWGDSSCLLISSFLVCGWGGRHELVEEGVGGVGGEANDRQRLNLGGKRIVPACIYLAWWYVDGGKA
jgi:hypothetical protein